MAFYTGRETLIDYIVQDIPDGEHTFQTVANDELVNIEVEFYNFYDDVMYHEEPVLGNNTPDARMLILKYHRNLTIGDNVLITPQVRKRGMFVYVAKELVNFGIISMTARGAIAAGQNVYICREANGELAMIPAVGGAGGASVARTSSGSSQGGAGYSAVSRSTGGGGGGGANKTGGTSAVRVAGGTGGRGTSYSGGTGGGGASTSLSGTAGSGSINGGEGGTGRGGGGGAGNPSGSGGTGNADGTGGLLIIYSEKKIFNQFNGIITSNGVGGKAQGGGGSGGGSINIFILYDFVELGFLETKGGIGGGTSPKGGQGGDGSITVSTVCVDVDRINILNEKYFRQTEVDLGNVIEGSYTEIQTFYLENMYNQDLTELSAWWEHKNQTNDKAVLQISKTKDPFVPENELIFEQVIPYRSRVPFYMRLVTGEGAEAGEFVLKTKVKSIPN